MQILLIHLENHFSGLGFFFCKFSYAEGLYPGRNLLPLRSW